jgi:VanZ family protein
MNLLKRLLNFQRHNKALNYSLFILYASGVTALSVSPHVNIAMAVSFQDKIHHLLAYAIFTLLAWRIAATNISFWRLAIGIGCYSALIEVIQNLTGRTMSLLDIVANVAGIICAVWFISRVSSTTT